MGHILVPPRFLFIVLFCCLMGFLILRLIAPVQDSEWVSAVRLLQWRDPHTGKVLEFRDPVKLNKVLVDREADLDVQVQQLRSMTHVSLSYQSLTSLPPELGDLSNLEGPTLLCNELTTLPPEIGNLDNLTHLAVANNQLETLPPEIGKLSQLETLLLNDNKLVKIPS